MKIISETTDFQLDKASSVAIGKFDGVHLGHRLLIDDIVSYAKTHENCNSVIFTFNPSPESLFLGRSLPELTTVSEKRSIFERMGVDVVIEFPMNKDTADTPADEFIGRYLSKQMRSAYITAGSDLSFGSHGSGNSALLLEHQKEFGYTCRIMDKVTYKGEEISSTRIREAVECGRMELAAAMLGSPYRITGTVSHGRKLGHTIGMPTANVIIAPDKVTGPRGVYYSRVITTDGEYPSISNVGVKPTVMNDELPCCESYLYGFDGDIYGEHIEVELLEFLRPEYKFGSITELKNQMEKDIERGSIFHKIRQ